MICDLLQEAATPGAGKRVVIELPPRMGKSEVCSRKFPSWYLGNYPDNEVILASYSADLAEDLSRVARSTLRNHADLFGIKLSSESQSVSRWGLSGHRGCMVACGVGGPLTGRGADILIIDDPHKNWEEAQSQSRRDHVWDWWLTVARTRLSPGGTVVIVMTRWHQDDLVGRLKQSDSWQAGQWTEVRIPYFSEGEDTDPLKRPKGAPLWPERFRLVEVQELRRDMHPTHFEALYQQSPTPPGGSLFKRRCFRYYTKNANILAYVDNDGRTRTVDLQDCAIFQTSDPAGTSKTSSDYFVLATWGVDRDRNLFLLDVYRDRLDGPDQPRIYQELYNRFRPVKQGVETNGIGLHAMQYLQRLGLPVHGITSSKDKWLRALPLATRYESGTVYHPARADWLAAWESELIQFPTGEYDDQVDAGSMAAIMLPEIYAPGTGVAYESIDSRRVRGRWAM